MFITVLFTILSIGTGICLGLAISDIIELIRIKKQG